MKVLSWGIVLMLLGSVACSRDVTPSAPPARTAPPPAASVPPPLVAQEKKPEDTAYTYDPQGRRDPFRPLVAEKPGRSGVKGIGGVGVNELKLAGIVWENNKYYALVEAPTGIGYVLRPNDIVGGDARVTKITEDTVLFEIQPSVGPPRYRARILELKLKKEE